MCDCIRSSWWLVVRHSHVRGHLVGFQGSDGVRGERSLYARNKCGGNDRYGGPRDTDARDVSGVVGSGDGRAWHSEDCAGLD